MALVWVLCVITLSISSMEEKTSRTPKAALPPPPPAALSRSCLWGMVPIKYPVAFDVL